MLRITVPAYEDFDESSLQFLNRTEEQTLEMEHSLVSLSKWESKWCKPFFSNEEKSYEETVDYIKCMTITPDVDPLVFEHLTRDNIEKINNYINAPMTATTFSKDTSRPSREIVTSELIYYWMIALNIPSEYESWHINRLMTLVKICGIKNQPPKRMSKRDIMSRNAALNASRRQQLHSRG